MLCLLSSALAWHWRGAGSHVAIPRMARTVTSWGWVMPCCHWLPGEIAAVAAAVWHFSSGPLKGGDAILLGSLPGCILPPTWPWNQAELEHPRSATALAPAPAVIALSHLHRPASSFFSLSSRSAPHHHGLPPPPLLVITCCLSFTAKAMIAANAEPVPVSAACKQVRWKWHLFLDPTWPWQGVLGCIVCMWIWGLQLDSPESPCSPCWPRLRAALRSPSPLCALAAEGPGRGRDGSLGAGTGDTSAV